MAKYYKIKLAAPDEALKSGIGKNVVNDEDGKPVYKRNVERNVLALYARVYGNNQKDIKDMNYASTLLRTIEDLDDGENLIVDERDIKIFKEAITLSAGNRMGIAMDLPELHQQIENPEETEIQEKTEQEQ